LHDQKCTRFRVIVIFGDDILTEGLGSKALIGATPSKTGMTRNYLDYKDFSHRFTKSADDPRFT
jgi:hypothetical protein